MRPLLVSLIVLAAIGLLRAPAYAEAEICPAHVSELYAADKAHMVFGFQLEAPTARSAAGNLAIETDRGWYRIPFTAALLTKTVRRYVVSALPKSFQNTVFASQTLYARFPQPVVIRNGWVEKASATGDTGWGAGVPFACYPTVPSYVGDAHFKSSLDADGASAISVAPATAMPVISAQAVPPIENTSCPHPFVDARAVTMVAPHYPYSGSMPDATSLVKVTILPSGSVGDATVAQSSGFAAFDVAALEAAERSTYLPKIVYCRPGIGQYLFRVLFTHR
ncbi:MAG: energy transducer TonB [Candidatus Eremiobacteraeota bacterium]|nr:energy transducer TonB [Candidatus Eremiobacteraeota bacterium]